MMDGYLAFGVVDLSDHLLQGRHMRVPVDAQLPGGCLALGTDIGMAGNDQPHVPSRQVHQQLCETLGREALYCGQPFPRSGPDETIGQSHTVEDRLFEKFCHTLLLRDSIDSIPPYTTLIQREDAEN